EEFVGDDRAIRRFEREARTLSALDHPNICTVYGVEEYQGHPIIAMQWLQGETLRERIEGAAAGQGPVSPEELVRTGSAILEALEAAHEKTIIHRDVKPAKVFRTRRGEIKLLDFGLATLVGARAQEEGRAPAHPVPVAPADPTQTGTTMGTASYMAPEQVQGGALDGRTDLFSLGVVLYEMATGTRPFHGSGIEELHQAILTATPTPPTRLNPALPPALGAVIERALAKSPAERFQSAQEM